MDFNLSQAQPTGLDVDALLSGAPEVPDELRGHELRTDFAAMEAKRFTKPERAMAAITPEDLAFEAELQRMHVESDLAPVDGVVPVKLTAEEAHKELLSDVVEGTQPAKNLADLEQQVFLAKGHGCNAIEADEKVIRYFTRNRYEETAKIGYLMYKDIKVFIPGKFAGHLRTDKQSMHDKLFGQSKVK